MDAYAFDEPDAAWNALGDLAKRRRAGRRRSGPRPGKVKPGKKRGRSEEDEGDEGAKKRIVERGGRPGGHAGASNHQRAHDETPRRRRG